MNSFITTFNDWDNTNCVGNILTQLNSDDGFKTDKGRRCKFTNNIKTNYVP